MENNDILIAMDCLKEAANDVLVANNEIIETYREIDKLSRYPKSQLVYRRENGKNVINTASGFISQGKARIGARKADSMEKLTEKKDHYFKMAIVRSNLSLFGLGSDVFCDLFCYAADPCSHYGFIAEDVIVRKLKSHYARQFEEFIAGSMIASEANKLLIDDNKKGGMI